MCRELDTCRWAVGKAVIRKMKYLRRVSEVKKGERRRNGDIKKTLGVNFSSERTLEDKKLMWFGHLIKMEEGR